eukprot:scaffold602_cov342-Prasinococcus_capsulatus_cf.AAC.21
MVHRQGRSSPERLGLLRAGDLGVVGFDVGAQVRVALNQEEERLGAAGTLRGGHALLLLADGLQLPLLQGVLLLLHVHGQQAAAVDWVGQRVRHVAHARDARVLGQRQRRVLIRGRLVHQRGHELVCARRRHSLQHHRVPALPLLLGAAGVDCVVRRVEQVLAPLGSILRRGLAVADQRRREPGGVAHALEGADAAVQHAQVVSRVVHCENHLLRPAPLVGGHRQAVYLPIEQHVDMAQHRQVVG